MIEVEVVKDQEQWDSAVLDGAGHPLQLWGWGEVKSRGNWRAERVFVRENDKIIGLSQLLVRPLPWPLKNLVYVPRGPVAAKESRAGVLEALANHAKKKHGAVAISVEPDWQEVPALKSWRRSTNTILLPRTVALDLSDSEEALLGAMTKKTRQYIRKSEKSGVEIRMVKTPEDIAACLEIYKQTAERAGFGLHKDSYYEDIFATLGSHCQVFMATHEEKVVAFLWLAVSEEVAFELYGGMSDEGQRLRANYILKWEAIRRTKEWGVVRYDMNGLLNDGVSKFKQGFSDKETMLAGTYEKPLSPLYVLWARGLPLAKNLLQKIKR